MREKKGHFLSLHYFLEGLTGLVHEILGSLAFYLVQLTGSETGQACHVPSNPRFEPYWQGGLLADFFTWAHPDRVTERELGGVRPPQWTLAPPSQRWKGTRLC